MSWSFCTVSRVERIVASEQSSGGACSPFGRRNSVGRNPSNCCTLYPPALLNWGGGGSCTNGGSLRVIPPRSTPSQTPRLHPALRRNLTGSKGSTLQNLLVFVTLELCDLCLHYFFFLDLELLPTCTAQQSTAVAICALVGVSQEFGHILA